MLSRGVTLGLLAVLSVSLAGCGGSAASATGTVTYDGTPIDDGTINFVPEKSDGRKPVGEKITNGKYEIPSGRGLAAGKYKVEITWTKAAGPRKGEKVDPDVTSGSNQALPDKYNKQTTLTADVKAGSNEINFPLTK
jgi:hypothetical protein